MITRTEASVSEAIRAHVAQLVAAAPLPTHEQAVQLLQWFGPETKTRLVPTTASLIAETDREAS